VLKNKHQAVSQGVRRFGKRSPPAADEHLQKPHNSGSRPQALFFNALFKGGRPVRAPFSFLSFSKREKQHERSTEQNHLFDDRGQ
jgi:hypothetical protein